MENDRNGQKAEPIDPSHVEFTVSLKSWNEAASTSEKRLVLDYLSVSHLKVLKEWRVRRMNKVVW